ncbi:hypothetical protein E4P41_16025 [Geodermatophilus sp. DF01-2]|nr:hypothetical protein E4P41_16025 [Geodermatophilus sp. DF01_2]
MSFFAAPRYARAYFAVISARDAIDNPLPMPGASARGHSYVRHHARFAGTSGESRRGLGGRVGNAYTELCLSR